jgi:hypothetical protein
LSPQAQILPGAVVPDTSPVIVEVVLGTVVVYPEVIVVVTTGVTVLAAVAFAVHPDTSKVTIIRQIIISEKGFIIIPYNNPI